MSSTVDTSQPLSLYPNLELDKQLFSNVFITSLLYYDFMRPFNGIAFVQMSYPSLSLRHVKQHNIDYGTNF